MMCSDREFVRAVGVCELRVHAAYGKLPFRFLELAFAYVPPELQSVSFEAIDACKGVPRIPHDIDFDIYHHGQRAGSDEILDGMARRRMRPVLNTELLSIAFAYRLVPLMFKLVALGSFVKLDDEPYALYAFTTDGINPSLYLVEYGGPYDADCRFPVVPI